MAPKIEALVKGLTLSEAPHWDYETLNLYFVDMAGKTIGKYNYVTRKYTYVSVEPFQSTFIIPIQNRKNQFITSLTDQIAIIEWDGESDKINIIKQLEKMPNEFNDGRIDPAGRLWTGTNNINFEDVPSTPSVGVLYSVNSKYEIKQHFDNIKISNGLTFNPKTNKFYHIDSLNDGITQYDYNKTTGTISNGRKLFSLTKHDIPGIADGMNIDADGNLWVAIFGGGRIIKISGEKPETLLDTIEMPTQQVTSVAFGGPNLSELYVTTASLDVGGFLAEPTGGIVYRVTGLDVKGALMDKFLLD